MRKLCEYKGGQGTEAMLAFKKERIAWLTSRLTVLIYNDMIYRSHWARRGRTGPAWMSARAITCTYWPCALSDRVLILTCAHAQKGTRPLPAPSVLRRSFTRSWIFILDAFYTDFCVRLIFCRFVGLLFWSFTNFKRHYFVRIKRGTYMVSWSPRKTFEHCY